MGVVATNLFTNPRAATATTGYTSSLGTSASTSVTGMGPSTTAFTWTRTSTGSYRVGFQGGTTAWTASSARTVRITARSSVDLANVPLYYRVNTGSTTGQVLVGTYSFLANVTQDFLISFTTSADTVISSTGLVFAPTQTGTIGDMFWITNVMVLAGTVTDAYFDGSIPDTLHTVYSWTSTADASTSTKALVDLAEQDIPEPFGAVKADNSKAHMTIVYRGGWLG